MKNKKKDAMVKVIEAGEDGIREAENILARLWRIVLYRHQLTGAEWVRLINNHVVRSGQSGKHGVRGTQNLKGNLTGRLAEPRISWSLLMSGLEILTFPKMEVTLTLHRKGKIESITIEQLTAEEDEETE